MHIDDLLSKYSQRGYSLNDARNLAAEQIILEKIERSEFCSKVTLKGGIVMFQITNYERTVTKDIDIDFMKYPLTEPSIYNFIDCLNKINDGFKLDIITKPTHLHHEDYSGFRVFVRIVDKNKSLINFKLDIGVHPYYEISQKYLEYSCFDEGRSLLLMVNSCEQIFVEKLIALAKIGESTTRYKDIFDIYYLIVNRKIHTGIVRKMIRFYLSHMNKEYDTNVFKNDILNVLNNKMFLSKLINMKSYWLNEDLNKIIQTIKDYLNRIC